MKNVFKALVLFVAVVSMTTLTSCTKEKEDLIIGKWKFADITMTCSDPETQETIDAMMPYFEEMFRDFVMEFKSDNTVEASSDALGLGDEDEEDEPVTVKYSIDGETLIFNATYADGVVENSSMKIVSLTKTDLVLESVVTDEGVTYTETLTLKRI